MGQEALEALRRGDFDRAATLLAEIVRGNSYKSDVLNHAYTVALHACGRKGEMVEAAWEIGQAKIQTDRAAALDYFQRAIFGGLDAARTRQVCELQKEWGPERQRPKRDAIRTDRVAHVIGCFLPGHAPSLYIQLLARALDDLGVRSTVFTTEWAAAWFFNPPGAGQSQPVEVRADTVVGGLEGDFMARAERVAESIRAAGIDIALYHCGPTEQLTIRVAALRPAPIQINVNHATEVDADMFEGFAHLFENGLERTRFPHRPCRWIPLISDIEERMSACRPVTRAELGLEDAETVSGTFGNLFKVSSTEYVRTLARILKRYPGHVHIFAGSGDEDPIRGPLEAEGVLERVKFLGYMDDIAGLLGAIDLCLNSFPVSGGQSVLEPMAAGKPVVIFRHPGASHFNAGVELAGAPDLTADTEDAYVEIAGRLIEDAALRDRLGRVLQQRFQANFRPEQLGRRYLKFFDEVIDVSTA